MTNPYDLYVRYLATAGLDDLVLVNDKLKEIGLPPISQSDIDAQWEVIHKSLPVFIVNQIERKTYSSEFLRNMKVLQLEEMWLCTSPYDKREPDAKSIIPYMNYAISINKDGWLRTNINSLLMKRVTLEEISRILSNKFSIALKEKHIGFYAKYFFDISAMTKADWKLYINKYAGKEYHIYFTALTESADVLKNELELPAVISVSDSLQYLLTKSYIKAKTFINMNTIESGREARAWIDQVMSLTDKYEKHRSGDQHDFAKSLQMEFDFSDEEFASPDDEMVHELVNKTAPKETK